MQHLRPDVMIAVGVRDDDGFKVSSRRGNLVSQSSCLAYPKLTIDQDCFAFSIDQDGRYAPAVFITCEDVEVEFFGGGRKCALSAANHHRRAEDDCIGKATA